MPFLSALARCISSLAPLYDSVRLHRVIVRDAAYIIFALASVSFVGYFLYAARRASATPIAALAINREQLDFGTVWAQPRFERSFTIQNSTSCDIKIAAFEVSCRCTSVIPGSLLVPANQQRDVTLVLDLRPTSDAESNLPEREFRVQLRPLIRDASPMNLVWTIRGNVRNAIVPSVRSIAFGDLSVFGRDFPPKSIQVAGLIPLADVRVESGEASSNVSATIRHVSEGTYEVTVVPDESLTLGPLSGNIVLTPIPLEGDPVPPTVLAVTGQVVRDVHVVPSRIDFGAHAVGDLVHETLVLQSRTGRDLQIDHVAVPGMDVALDRVPMHDTNDIAFRLTQRIANVGRCHVVIRLIVEGEEILVPLSYDGFVKKSRDSGSE